MLSEQDMDTIADILDCTIDVRWDGLLSIGMEDIIDNLRAEGYEIVKKEPPDAKD